MSLPCLHELVHAVCELITFHPPTLSPFTTAIRLVELPLPGRNGNPPAQQDPLEAAAAAAGVDEGSVGLMQQQGLSRADALAALLLEEGSADEALVRAVTCQELGGAAKVWADMQPARGLDDPLQAAEVRGRGSWNEHCGFELDFMWCVRRRGVCGSFGQEHGTALCIG